MLNIGKLGHDAATYYLETVASGVEDYYLHAGEAPGQWLGAGSDVLALRGEVRAEDLRRILDGNHPGNATALGNAQGGRERLPGYDLTFRAPKSVSLLLALGEGEVSREVKLGHEVAVRAALGYLEREAAFSRRRGEDGMVPVRGEGFVAASFQHRTSRAGDPLLHHHVLVANLVRDAEGRWGALDGRLIYGHAKTAGYLYQTELRVQLSRRLGVRWTPVVKGTADLKGISPAVIRAFSRRRSEIVARMAERGESSARAAQVAALDTRRAKDHEVKPEGLLPEWRSRAAALGLTADKLARVVGRSETVGPVTDAAVAKAMTALAAPTGLTAHSSTFSRRDVVRALCERLGPGADAAALEHAADSFVATPAVMALTTVRAPAGGRAIVRVTSGRVVPAIPDECRFTTAEMLATERRVIVGCSRRNVQARQLATGPREVTTTAADGSQWVTRRPEHVPEEIVEGALRARPSLSDEQRAMVRRLTTSPDAVMMVRGHAGTGKTSALDACRHIWERAGRTVIGCALSGRAAAELQAGAGIQSTTIDRLLIDLVDHREELLPQGDAVIVMDEAGMVGTRLLDRLLTVADQRDATVILVGDDRQLPEIDAGGVYRALSERLAAVELVENRRQREEWERQALVLLREGRSQEAVAAYVEHGRVVLGPSGDCVRAHLVADWWAAQQTGDGDNVMVALRRADVRELNERARALRVAAGDVTGPTLGLPTGEFAVGDRVVTGRNRRALGVVNGSRGTLVAVDERERTVTMQLDGSRPSQPGRVTMLPAEYLDAGHLAHGYAITGHKAQGMTAERAFVLGDEAMYREWGYVALSRGRAENRLYVVAEDLDPRDDTGHGRIPPSSSERLTLRTIQDAWMETRGHQLALERFEAVAGKLPRPEEPPPPSPPESLDDRALVAAAKAAHTVIWHGEPFPTLAEPSLHDPARTAAELSERRRDLTERRAELEVKVATQRAQLAATEGPIARRRHRQQREDWQRDVWVCSRQLAGIEQHLPVVEARLTNIRNDQLALDGWYSRREEACWRWRELHDEAGIRIERRVQAAEAAPSSAGHPASPPSLSARSDWWGAAVELERSRLWEGAQPTDSDEAQRPERGDDAMLVSEKRPDVAAMLAQVNEAEEAAEQRSERQREQESEWATDRYASHHAASWSAPKFEQEYSAHRGPSLGL
jgi:conjugative relaxase-like TrwC/TraI family protein